MRTPKKWELAIAASIIMAVLMAVLMPSVPGSGPTTTVPLAQAQSTGRTFPETGYTVSGRFLEYWNTHGGLAQQGFPISQEMQEVSPTDGKNYTVQYFERAVFERHPENSAPNDVLLSLLGAFRYREKYPQGAPAQLPNVGTGSRLFPETNKRVGGVFLNYWTANGALVQQGLPISDEFLEVSPLDGKQYKVQYFERAVFEYHPENTGSKYEVLLSQLGKLRYDARQAAVRATPVQTATVGADCSGIPQNDNGITITPNCLYYGTEMVIHATGFQPGETVEEYPTRPNGKVGFPHAYESDADDKGDYYLEHGYILTPLTGVWAFTLAGQSSGRRLVGYIKVLGPDTSVCTDGAPPPSVDANAIPVCGVAGRTYFEFGSIGFQPGEQVGVYLTEPTQAVYGAPWQGEVDAQGAFLEAYWEPPTDAMAGVWSLTIEGVNSHHKAVAYFKLSK